MNYRDKISKLGVWTELESQERVAYVLTWIGAVTGILGVILAALALVHPQGFPLDSVQLGYMAGSALLATAVTGGFTKMILKAIQRPDLEVVSITQSLTIKDRLGSDAELLRTQVYKANRRVVDHTLIVGGIASTGQIKEIKIDDQDIPQSNWERVLNDFRVSRTKTGLVPGGSNLTRTFWMRAENSFPKSVETLQHDVSQEMRELILEVKFPKDRIPLGGKLFCYQAFGDQTHKRLPDPVYRSGTYVAFTTIKKPRLGSVYRIEWEW